MSYYKMVRSFWVKTFVLLFMMTLAFFTGSISRAAMIEEIADDLKPLSGYVVMPSNGEYIIDLDATQGVVVGDLFSVISSGEKIVHPKTGNVLGALEKIEAILKVTRIKSGHSYARPLTTTPVIKRGDPIRRYGSMPVIFWDYTGQGGSFFAELQSVLPELKWPDYATSQRSRPSQIKAPAKTGNTLIFIMTQQGIEVRDPDFIIIHKYDLPESSALKTTVPSGTDVEKPTAAVGPPVLKKPLQAEGPEFMKLHSGGVKTIGQLVPGTVMADFIEHSHRLLLASTDGAEIEVFAVSDQLIPVARESLDYIGQILTLKWWLPSPGDDLYLTVVTWVNKTVRSNVFILKQNQLVLFQRNMPQIIASFDLDGDSRPEALLSQRYDNEDFFGRDVKVLKLINGKLQSSTPSFSLPRRFTVTGSAFADLTGDGKLETIYLRNGILNIFRGKERLYQSSKQMGGTLSYLSYDVDPDRKVQQPTNAYFEVAPVVKDLDNDGLPEILTVASERTVIGTFAPSRSTKKNWLAVVKFQDGRFVDGILGEEMTTPLQGLAVSGKELLFVATESPSLTGKAGNSHLLAYSLGQ